MFEVLLSKWASCLKTPRGTFEGRRTSQVWFDLLPLCRALCISWLKGDLCWTNNDCVSVSRVKFAFSLCLKWQVWVPWRNLKADNVTLPRVMMLLLRKGRYSPRHQNLFSLTLAYKVPMEQLGTLQFTKYDWTFSHWKWSFKQNEVIKQTSVNRCVIH